MSVEKMKMMGIIGKKKLLDKISRLVVLNESMHMINALSRVNSADFFLAPSEKNIEALEEEPFLKPCSPRRDFDRDEEMVQLLQNLFNIKPEIKKDFLGQDYDYDTFMGQFYDIDKTVRNVTDEIKEKIRLIEKNREYINNLEYLSIFQNIDIGRLVYMKYLVFHLIKISRENYDKLKKNYENIPAVVLKVATEGKHVILASVAPQTLEENLEKVFSSLNYNILPIPKKLNGTVKEIIGKLNKNIEKYQEEIEKLKKSLEIYREKYQEELEKGYSRLEMEKRVESLKSDIAVGKKLFFMFGFVPVNNVLQLKNELEKYFGDQLIILIDEVNKSSSGITPPTKLNNVKFFRPFEMLVKMYDTPNYQEKDPTVFFGLTYMILFGAMFGDVGQGFVFFLTGIILEFLLKKDIGGILSRIGLSSMIFGFFYGSVFGFEEVLPALIIRPMENINQMLIASVIFGAMLMVSSYIYGIINSIKGKNIQEALLGKNGLAGFLFYLLLLFIVYQSFVAHQSISMVYVILLIVLLILMLFKMPLSYRLLLSDSMSVDLSVNYYIEEGFGILEMLLSMFSNTVSFLRVGAFALNHIGLFVAFLTLSKMINSSLGSWSVLVLGNIIILVLEGLIVLIQALRLEYYEMFTKYYHGEGIDYVPVKMDSMMSL